MTHPNEPNWYRRRAVAAHVRRFVWVGLALSCATSPAEPPRREPVAEAAPKKPQPQAQPKAPECRDAYDLQLLTANEELGTPKLVTHAREMTEVAETCPPKTSRDAAMLAIAHMVRDEFEAAETAAELAVEVRPDSAFAYFSRGIVASAQDRHVPAEADFRKALELDPNLAEAHLELGLLLEAEGRIEESRISLAAASSVRPGYILGSYYLAVSYLEAGDVEAAAPHCEATLEHTGDNDMFMCRGLARAAAGDYKGALYDLSGLYSTSLTEPFEEEMSKAMRDAFLATGDPVSAASHTCLDSYGLDDDDCEDKEVARAVERLRSKARQAATEGSFAAAYRMSSAQFARELSKQAKQAKDLQSFIHPDVGVFIFHPYGWMLHRQTTWPAVPEANRDLDLRALSRVTRLPKSYQEETNDLDCSYPLDSVVNPGDPGAFSMFYNGESMKVSDSYRLSSYPWFTDMYGEEFDEAEFAAMKRAALAITHHVIYARERYEFGKIEDQWYLLAVSVDYDPEHDGCG